MFAIHLLAHTTTTQLKALGEQEKAMEKYVAALHVYVDIAGQNNTSYASALANIGECISCAPFVSRF